MVEDDDDDSDYGRPRRKNSKVSRRSKDKKSPKPRIRTSGTTRGGTHCIYCCINHNSSTVQAVMPAQVFLLIYNVCTGLLFSEPRAEEEAREAADEGEESCV